MIQAQTGQPLPTATPLPVATPTPPPVGGDSPALTITPGLPTAAETDAYVAARTPLVDVTLGTGATATTVRLGTQGGFCPAVTLPPATSPQPVATVTLTYLGVTPGQLVWVQMARPAGALSATDGKGNVYPGDHGFSLTLGAAGVVTFTYQAPSVGGTYQILARFDNVLTVVPFRVLDATP